MKRVFLVFMSLMFIMCLAGCGEKEENDYIFLNDLVNIEEINELRFVKGFSSYSFHIEKKEIIYNIINILDVPYIDRISLSNNDIEIYDKLFYDSTEDYSFSLEITDNFYMNFWVYSPGYVNMSIINNNISKRYISIVRVNFNELKNICKYENLWEE